MLPCYKGHKSSSEGIERDLKQQEHNHTRKKLKGLEEEEEKPWKHNLSKEQDEYEIRQNTTTMKTTNKKIRECIKKRQKVVVKLKCL
jgi:hypothetical protein